MRNLLIAILSFLLVVSCASHPSDIPAAAISAVPYQSLTCDQLSVELANSQNNLNEASKRQKRKRNMDGWSNALLIPGVMSIAKDSSEAVAQFKGEVQTITREISRRCLTKKGP